MKIGKTPFRRWLGLLSVIALSAFVIVRIYYAVTDDFRLGNITYEMPYEKSWEIDPLPAEQESQLNQILAQPYFYLGKGAQSYVFASQDGRYVLKFFKFKHLRPSWFVDRLPSVGPIKTYKEKQAARKERRLLGVFRSYRLAYELNREEGGLIFIQLNAVNNLKRSVTVIDKIGLRHTIDLENYPFIVQYKGESLRVVLARLLDEGDLNTVKRRIGQIFDVYAGEYRKGIYDHDHGVMRNTGFIAEQPLHLDLGKLMREENMKDKTCAKQDALLVVAKIKAWVKRNYPRYHEELSSYIDGKIEQLFE